MGKKYVITSKDDKTSAPGDDIIDIPDDRVQQVYTELGWELQTSHIEVKRMWIKGELSEKDIVVCSEGRQFMYSHLPMKIINWHTFKSQKLNEDDLVLDFLEDKEKNIGTMIEGRRSGRITEAERKEIIKCQKIDTFKLHGGKHYACIQIRTRDHVPHRSGPPELWKYLINNFLSMFENVFIVGLGTEDWCKIAPNRIHHVSLLEYINLLQQKECAIAVGPASGPTMCGIVFGKTPTYVFDFEGSIIDGKINNMPVCYGHKGNIAEIPLFIYDCRTNLGVKYALHQIDIFKNPSIRRMEEPSNKALFEENA